MEMGMGIGNMGIVSRWEWE